MPVLLIMQSSTRVDWRGREGVAIVYRNTLEIVRCSVVVKPGLEALHMSIGARVGIGILLGYHASHDPAISFVSTALLESLRLLVLGDFNIHAEVEISGPALEFLETMASLDIVPAC